MAILRLLPRVSRHRPTDNGHLSEPAIREMIIFDKHVPIATNNPSRLKATKDSTRLTVILDAQIMAECASCRNGTVPLGRGTYAT